MAGSIGFPTELRTKLETFQAEQSLSMPLNENATGDVTVEIVTERKESSPTLLYSGGWLSCATAWEMSDILGISKAQMGMLLDLLEVKVRNCDLGCF